MWYWKKPEFKDSVTRGNFFPSRFCAQHFKKKNNNNFQFIFCTGTGHPKSKIPSTDIITIISYVWQSTMKNVSDWLNE